MQNNKLALPSQENYSDVSNLTEQTPLLRANHPFTQFYSLFPTERYAMDSAMQILAKVAIILNEAEYENPQEVRVTMQGFRNIYSSFEEYYNKRF